MTYLWGEFGVLLFPVVEDAQGADNEEGVPHTTP